MSWILVGQALRLSEFIHVRLAKSPISWISNIIRILLVGVIMSFLFILIFKFVNLDYFEDSLVYNMADKKNPNPYEFTVSSEYYNKSITTDVRPLLDISLAAGVGKSTVMAIKSAPAPFKAGVGVATALSLGAVSLALRNSSYGVDQARSTVIKLGDKIIVKSTVTPSSSSNDGSSPSGGSVVNSPSEDFNVFDTMCSILMCTKVLVAIALVVIIVAVITAYVISSGNKLQGKSNFTLINRFSSYILKAGYLYSLICTGLACFNLIWSLYFINKLIEMVEILSGK